MKQQLVKLSDDHEMARISQLVRVLQSVDLTKMTNGTNEALYQGVKFVSFAV